MELDENMTRKLDLGVAKQKRKPIRIGGLLSLVLVWLIYSILYLSIGIINTLHLFITFTMIPSVLFGVMVRLILVVFTVIIITNFFMKKKYIPRMMIINSSLYLLISVIDFLIKSYLTSFMLTEQYIISLIGVILSSTIYVLLILYFKKSKRVKNTFVS